jgi:uncharacterized protein involved in exopolysaccharide biosynthesis
MEEARLRNIADLQKSLADLNAVYTNQHPAVIRAQERLDAASREPAQLMALRADVDELEARLAARRRPRPDSHVEPVVPAAIAPVELPPASEPEDPAVEAARARLRFALDKIQNLRARADSAALELEARRAAFKYRYSVVVPAEPPRGPMRPKVAAVGAAGVVAGVVLAAFGAVVADLRGGRLVESWQVERALRLPVLAELTGP